MLPISLTTINLRLIIILLVAILTGDSIASIKLNEEYHRIWIIISMIFIPITLPLTHPVAFTLSIYIGATTYLLITLILTCLAVLKPPTLPQNVRIEIALQKISEKIIKILDQERPNMLTLEQIRQKLILSRYTLETYEIRDVLRPLIAEQRVFKYKIPNKHIEYYTIMPKEKEIAMFKQGIKEICVNGPVILSLSRLRTELDSLKTDPECDEFEEKCPWFGEEYYLLLAIQKKIRYHIAVIDSYEDIIDNILSCYEIEKDVLYNKLVYHRALKLIKEETVEKWELEYNSNENFKILLQKSDLLKKEAAKQFIKQSKDQLDALRKQDIQYITKNELIKNVIKTEHLWLVNILKDRLINELIKEARLVPEEIVLITELSIEDIIDKLEKKNFQVEKKIIQFS